MRQRRDANKGASPDDQWQLTSNNYTRTHQENNIDDRLPLDHAEWQKPSQFSLVATFEVSFAPNVAFLGYSRSFSSWHYAPPLVLGKWRLSQRVERLRIHNIVAACHELLLPNLSDWLLYNGFQDWFREFLYKICACSPWNLSVSTANNVYEPCSLHPTSFSMTETPVLCRDMLWESNGILKKRQSGRTNVWEEENPVDHMNLPEIGQNPKCGVWYKQENGGKKTEKWNGIKTISTASSHFHPFCGHFSTTPLWNQGPFSSHVFPHLKPQAQKPICTRPTGWLNIPHQNLAEQYTQNRRNIRAPEKLCTNTYLGTNLHTKTTFMLNSTSH